MIERDEDLDREAPLPEATAAGGTEDSGSSDEGDGNASAVRAADPRVDDAVARLSELRDLPTSEHVAVYEDIHSRLSDALSDLGDPAPPPPSNGQHLLGDG